MILAILYFGRVVFITSITAVIISFILDPFVQLLVRLRCPRSLAAFLVCLLGGLVVYGLAMGLYIQASGLAAALPQIGERVAGIVETMRQKIEKMEGDTSRIISRQPAPPPPLPKTTLRKRATAPQTPPAIQEVRIHNDSNLIVDFIYPRLGSLYEAFLMVSFVPFLVYFLLSWGDHLNGAFLRFFHGEDRVIAAQSLQGIGHMVRAFVFGNFLLGVLLAIASTAGFYLVSMPFSLLAGPLSGFLSLIPYVGLPLALLPPLFAALGGATTFSGVFIVVLMVCSLHLVALNFLYPKLVGARVHLNPLVVTFALMFWGFFWDAPGLLLAIPMTAGIKAVCDNVRGLRPIGRFLGD